MAGFSKYNANSNDSLKHMLLVINKNIQISVHDKMARRPVNPLLGTRTLKAGTPLALHYKQGAEKAPHFPWALCLVNAMPQSGYIMASMGSCAGGLVFRWCWYLETGWKLLEMEAC